MNHEVLVKKIIGLVSEYRDINIDEIDINKPLEYYCNYEDSRTVMLQEHILTECNLTPEWWGKQTTFNSEMNINELTIYIEKKLNVNNEK